MEQNTLSAFFQTVRAWPEDELALSSVSEKVAKLLKAPFVAIQRADGCAKIGWSIDDPGSRAEPQAVQEFVKFELGRVQSLFAETLSAAPVLRQLQLSDGALLPWRSEGASSFAVFNISSDSHSSLSRGRTTQARIDYAWLVVGTARPLGSREEILALAAAQRLASLAELSEFESGIQLRNQFLSIASHELKTPLTSIYGVLQLQERMLRLKKEEPIHVAQERQASYLKMVIRQTQRLNELIDGLLDVSRIQNGRFMAEPSDTDVTALLTETLAGRLALIANEAGVRLSAEAPEGLHAWVDPVRMEEVVTNLAMNAIRFSPEGGVVWLRLREQDGVLKLTVRDQGPSVPEEDRERIFQPFERAQRTARFGGLGLGLFISRQITQLHGGNVVLAESTPGKGNLFEATFAQREEDSRVATG